MCYNEQCEGFCMYCDNWAELEEKPYVSPSEMANNFFNGKTKEGLPARIHATVKMPKRRKTKSEICEWLGWDDVIMYKQNQLTGELIEVNEDGEHV